MSARLLCKVAVLVTWSKFRSGRVMAQSESGFEVIILFDYRQFVEFCSVRVL